jgi:hypothetical protein
VDWQRLEEMRTTTLVCPFLPLVAINECRTKTIEDVPHFFEVMPYGRLSVCIWFLERDHDHTTSTTAEVGGKHKNLPQNHFCSKGRSSYPERLHKIKVFSHCFFEKETDQET